MPAFTSFLNLYKPGGGSTGLIMPDEVADIDRLNANSDLIDAWAVKVGNESTRQVHYAGLAAAMGGALVPPPKDGDTYQETDGNKILWRRVGGVWVTGENGMYLIRPASVVNGTVQSDGAVLPNAAAVSLSLVGVFTPRFKSYLISFSLGITSGGSRINFRFRAGGADEAGAFQQWQSMHAANSNSQAIGTGDTLIPVLHPGPASSAGDIRVYGPQHNGFKGVVATAGMTSGAGYAAGMSSGGFSSATLYDGFTLLPSASSFANTGFVKVYGLA